MPMLNTTIRWTLIALALAPLYAADCCRNSVAVVASLSGSATVRSPARPAKAAVSSLDWLSEGMTLEVGPGSQAVLILVNGHRYQLAAGAQMTLTANGVPKLTGAARELSPLPPIPSPAAIVAESAPTSGAVRVRGDAEVSDLYPRAGIVVLPDNVTLRFKAFPKAGSYRVTLENDGADNLLNVTTETTGISVPAGTLEAGAHYRWRVQALRAGIPIAVGRAEFDALSAENVLQRMEFASALGDQNRDASTLALLAQVDLRLGLVAEACDELSEALKQKPGDAALQRALDAARAQLAK